MRWLVCLLILAWTLPAWAAPLEPRDRWAEDAVARLREWGLVEGYPDGDFRGHRAVSRWEAAVLVARALARLEGQHAELASKAELQEVLAMAEALRPELEALGVRVTGLEEQADRLDARVTDLERIAFSGRMVTRVLGQTFYNTGNPASGVGPGTLNYNALVGSVAGSNLLPFGPTGVLPVIDMKRGRPLTNGAGFSTALYLDAALRPGDDVEAEVRLFAYTSQGDSVVDAVWGVTPPYLADSFTGKNFTGFAQGLPHVPFTTAGLDHVRVTHLPTEVSLTAGTFVPSRISPLVYLGPANPTVEGPAVLESFGLYLEGNAEPFSWEVFGTRLPDGNPGTVGPPYRSDALGAALHYREGPWFAGLSFLRASNQASAGGPLTVGEVNLIQAPPGRLYTDWVNPPGFFVGQLGGPGDPRVAGAGSPSDVRPVPGAAGSDALSMAATFGPQGITMGGVNLEWTSGEWSAFADYMLSDYRSNRNAAYNARGDLWRLGVEARLDEERIKLLAEYRSTDPTYDPFILTYPGTVAGLPLFRVYHRLPDWDMFWHVHSLHNTNAFPHNRRGFWLSGLWRYDPDGQLTLAYRNLEQVRTSLQDVRVPAGALGPGTPNATVLGHKPGHLDVTFREYSPLSFTAGLQPLEDVRGQAESWAAGLSHVFTGTAWRVDLAWESWHFRRPSGLSPALGGSQNHVDLSSATGRLAAGYAFSDDLLLTFGYERGQTVGHFDPFGSYNPTAIARGSTTFKNWDTVQHIPFVEVGWDVSDEVRVGLDYRYYQTVDRVPSDVIVGAPNGPGATAHPFSWEGQRVGTTFEVRF